MGFSGAPAHHWYFHPKVILSAMEDRARALRVHIINMIGRLGEGYLLQGLGAADLFSALFFSELNYDPARPDWDGRDRLILSTAHNSTILYASLAESGFFHPSALLTYGTDGSEL